MTTSDIQMIRPTSHAPYALRFITDDFAVEYRFSLMKGTFTGRIHRRERTDDLYSERFLAEWDTGLRNIRDNESDFQRNAEIAIESWRDPLLNASYHCAICNRTHNTGSKIGRQHSVYKRDPA